MSRSATTSASKLPSQLPSKSAWSKGPPQTASAPSPRSQSHSRRPSALGKGISVKDGVSVPRNNVGAVKQGTAVTFGSIDDVSAPLSTSPATAPPVKSEGVKPLGTVPNSHINGKASVASRPADPSTSTPSTSTSSASASTPSIPAVPASATPPPIKFDVRKFFQNPSTQPSNSSTSTETSTPSTSTFPASASTSAVPVSVTRRGSTVRGRGRGAPVRGGQGRGM